MADESCDITQTGPQSRYASEWGLATLLLAGFQTLAAMLMAMWIVPTLGNSRWRGASQEVLPIALVGITIVFWCSSVACLLFGRHSIRAAWARCQPGGLPVAGTLLAGLAFLLWSGLAVGLGLTVFYFRLLAAF